MPPTITYNPTAAAMLSAPQVVFDQQVTLLQSPISGLDEGVNYPVGQVLSLFPTGPLAESASVLADVRGATVAYRLVAGNNGTLVPEYHFFRQGETLTWDLPTQVRTGGGGPQNGGPGTNAGTVAVNLGGITVLVGMSMLLEDQGMPAPLIGPTMGSTFAIADTVFGNPATPTNTFFRHSLTAMGSGTAVQYGWSYGLDALGVDMGSAANQWGSFGGTLLTFAPVIESAYNPVYMPAFRNAFNSSIGVGLSGAGSSWLTRNIYLARGGWAGGAGFGGGCMQALGAVGAVLAGSSLGGWLTEEMTGMNDENDPYGQLARMARDRMYSDAWGALGRSPFGHLMAGLTVAFGYGDEFAEGLGYAEKSITRDARDFTRGLDPALLSLLMVNSTAQLNQPMATQTLNQGVMNFYSQYSRTMTDSYRVINILRQTYKLSDEDAGITRFVDAYGRITDTAAFNTYAANMAQRELTRRTNRLETLFREQGLTIVNGRVATTNGADFSQGQVGFIRGEGTQLTEEIIRLTNALATLRPTTVGAN